MWIMTSGPTREYLDDVRFLSNASSGQMGHALALAAQARGHELVMLQGPGSVPAPQGVELHPVVSARDMLAKGREILGQRRAELILGVAAVCDWRPEQRLRGKPPKAQGGRRLNLLPNPDVLAELVAMGRTRCALGFALQDFGQAVPGEEAWERELVRVEAVAREKIERKGLDAIVLNGISAMESSRSRAWWLPREGMREELRAEAGDGAGASSSKLELAQLIVLRCEALLRRS